jgi:hypothetical protein
VTNTPAYYNTEFYEKGHWSVIAAKNLNLKITKNKPQVCCWAG